MNPITHKIHVWYNETLKQKIESYLKSNKSEIVVLSAAYMKDWSSFCISSSWIQLLPKLYMLSLGCFDQLIE